MNILQKMQNGVTDDLYEDDKEELSNLVSEPFGFKTVSQQQLDEAIRQ